VNVAEAADQWEEAKREIRRLEPQLQAAAEVLKEYFRKNGKNNYKGRIGYGVGTRRTLDSKAVRLELGDRVAEFEKQVTVETLSLLK
jgi:hypothetical protein